MVLTVPISTSLYLTWVLPGSSPSALRKLMVISGPRSNTDLTTRPMLISAAINGTSQTSEGSQPLRRVTTASGSSGRLGWFGLGCGPCGLFMVFFRGDDLIPDQPGIELHRGEHGQDHHRAER